MMLVDAIREIAIRDPDRIFLIEERGRATYGEIIRQVDALACGFLANGLEKGQRVILHLGNSAEYVVSLLATMVSGGIAVSLIDLLPAGPVLSIARQCEASWVVTKSIPGGGIASEPVSGRWRKILVDPPDNLAFHPDGFSYRQLLADHAGKGPPEESPNPHDVAMILFTSGTSGTPKGVMLTHANLVANAESVISTLRLTSDDRAAVILPFQYAFGNSILTTHAMAGGSLALSRNFTFPNQVLDDIVREEATGLYGVPSTFSILLRRSAIRKVRFPKLRYIAQAGGPMAVEDAVELKQMLPDTDLCIMYGQTEACARLTTLAPSDFDRKRGSVGKAIPGVALSVRREDGTLCDPGEMGEVFAAGSNIMAGYWNDPEATSAVLGPHGLRTGDLGRLDREGFLFLSGRRNAMIKSGGHRIHPEQVEQAILELPGVSEVVVVGEPDDILGQSLTAYVVCEKGAFDSRTIQQFCRETLGPHMTPRRVIQTDHIPKTPSGKISRSQTGYGHGLCR